MANVDRRSTERIEAEKQWLASKGEMKLADLAGKLNVTASKVRKWKTLDKWEDKLKGKAPETKERKKKQVERSTKKATAKKVERSTSDVPAKKKVGAPLGNRNAVKHGCYSRLFWDVLDDDEKDMVMDMPDDEEQMLLDEIRIFTARERRIMGTIRKYRSYQKGEELSVSSVMRSEQKRQFKNDIEKAHYEELINEKVEKGERLPGDRYDVVTSTEHKDSVITRLEKELSTLQSKKAQDIQILANIRMRRQQMNEESAGNDIVTAWLAGFEDGGGDANGQ